MMASFLSNINIPAGSLFSPPGQSHCSILKALCEGLKRSLDIFSLCRFICLYPGDVPTCHIKHRLPYFLRAEVKTIERWVSLPQKHLPRDGYSVSRGQDRGFWHLHQSEMHKVRAQRREIDPLKRLMFFWIYLYIYFCMKWNPSGLRHGARRLITSVHIKFWDFMRLTKKIRVPKAISHCHLEPPKCKFNFTSCLFFSADIPHS